MTMSGWQHVEDEAPELAARAREFFGRSRHQVLATLRQDGSPRVSGIEVDFTDGELWIGCLWRSRKALDLLRDPRFALHSGSVDPPAWTGDAKVAGRAEEVTDPALVAAVNGGDAGEGAPSHLFRADVGEVVVVRLGEPADHLVIESWRPGRSVTRQERR
jgi:hypothetical protein